MSTTKHTGSPEEQAAERYPSPPWNGFYTIGYANCLRERAIPAEQEVERLRAENERLRMAGDEMKQWLGLTLQMDGEPCPECQFDYGRGHNVGCLEQRHRLAIDAWDAAKELNVTPTDR